jgi:very-short-patch-repair endonuclease
VGIEREAEITSENIGSIDNWGEKVFAEACLRLGIKATYQVPIGDSIIDFKIETRSGNEKLIEVTSSSKENARKLQRKMRQRKNMAKSGLGYSMLCSNQLLKIQQSNEKQR